MKRLICLLFGHDTDRQQPGHYRLIDSAGTAVAVPTWSPRVTIPSCPYLFGLAELDS